MNKKAKAPHFVMVTKELLNDPEWRKLSNSSKILWIYLRSKFNYKTKDTVTLAYSEIKDVMSSKTISKAYKELLEKNWIEKTKHGGLFGGLCSYKFNGTHKDFYPDKRKEQFYR